MKLCKCGCGNPVKGHLDHGDHGKFVNVSYLRGHNRKGYQPTDEQLRNQSVSHIGQVSWNKGKTASAETREKLRISHLGQSNRCGYKHSAESIEKMRSRKIGKKASAETIDKMRTAQRRKWASPDHARKMITAWRLKPNKKEKQLTALLDILYPEQWKFVGDGQVIIAGKCPDFINVNGQKKIIELFGDYWHRGQNPDDRVAVFAPFGYKTLVIWERELKHMQSVKDRIERFCAHED
jgi:G:T-mismatch repair DNA endonuclease (very short patch repair protein)